MTPLLASSQRNGNSGAINSNYRPIKDNSLPYSSSTSYINGTETLGHNINGKMRQTTASLIEGGNVKTITENESIDKVKKKNFKEWYV